MGVIGFHVIHLNTYEPKSMFLPNKNSDRWAVIWWTRDSFPGFELTPDTQPSNYVCLQMGVTCSYVILIMS
jgi:hypothetical protein